MAIMARRRTHGKGPYKPLPPGKPAPPKPGTTYAAQIRKILASTGFNPKYYKKSLTLFIGCADAISKAYKWWKPFSPGMTEQALYAWMKMVHHTCMSKKPAAMSCSEFFQNICKKAQHAGAKPAPPKAVPPRQGPIPARPRPKSPGRGPSTAPPIPVPPGKRPGRISPYVRGVKRRRRRMRG